MQGLNGKNLASKFLHQERSIIFRPTDGATKEVLLHPIAASAP